ncbi:Cleavage stimulation factor subunit 3 [Blattella germanica]|nr:Cleavage stimulation factor subunit 3 [Blattella germanica]
MKVLNIELWKLYLAYVKETKSTLPTYKEKMAQAYDFALEKIGMDIQSYSIWNDYVNFLKAVEAVGSYAENQKISAVRKVYQRGVINPMVNIEQLWKDYMNFEQNINPIIAEKMAMERSRDYMSARRVAKEFEAVTRGLNRNSPSVPPTGHPEELKQVDLWKKYIAWEKSNPLRTEDATLITRRVMFAFEQCLLCLGHHPDIWYEAAQFLEQSSKLLTEKGVYVQYMKFARRAEGIKSARTVFKRAREDTRSRFHVFVAAALMEYYCSKDKHIAFRIFELGLKKFSDNPEYILCYIDYLSHLNEDNNTRVLFERVLSSGSLEPEKSVDIWNRFLEFESNIGDLASIVKVEKRRSSVLGQIKEFEGKETAQLVDRYKFLDLYPCTPAELRPSQQVDRGVFPHPPAVAQLCTLLPPPGCFRGPFVAVDLLMDVFSKIQLPETAPSPTADNGCDTKLFDLAKSVHWIVDEGQEGTLTLPGSGVVKKRRKLGERIGEDSEDDDLSGAPPVNDIYRQRQQKRVK